MLLWRIHPFSANSSHAISGNIQTFAFLFPNQQYIHLFIVHIQFQVIPSIFKVTEFYQVIVFTTINQIIIPANKELYK